MRKQRLARNALASIAQVIISAGILFELYRFLIRQLGAEQIGVWSLVLASTAVARLADLGLGAGVIKSVAGDIGSRAPDSAARTVGMTVLLMALGLGLVCVVLYPLLWKFLVDLVPTAEALGPARELLPYALGSVWLAALGNVFLSALDGCQRTDLRAAITTGAAAVQLPVAYLVVPEYGLTGVGMTQFVQAGLAMVFGAVLVKRCFGQSWGAWARWDRRRFMELLRYGSSFQISAIGQLLFEPTVKVLLARFGGLALTGYYEMANRIVSQFRAVIVSAYQLLIPYVATSEKSEAEIRQLYLSAYRLLFYFAVPYYAFIAASMPLLLTAWLGKFEPVFLMVALLCCVGWATNTLQVPTYFLYLAIGRLRWIVWSNIAIGGLNVLFACIGGWLWGGIGVLVGAMLALALGSHIVTFAFHREFAIPLGVLLPRESTWLVAVGTIGATLVIGLAVALKDGAHWTMFLLAATFAFGLFEIACAWYNRNRKLLVSLLARPLLFNVGRGNE
jgi:O-antigen/teichoic acid export membrane protein